MSGRKRPARHDPSDPMHWNKEHYVVLYKTPTTRADLKKTLFNTIKRFFAPKTTTNSYHISDPAHGLITYTEKEFLKFWIGNNATAKTEEGVVLIVEPTPKFYTDTALEAEEQKFGFKFIAKYLFRYKRFEIMVTQRIAAEDGCYYGINGHKGTQDVRFIIQFDLVGKNSKVYLFVNQFLNIINYFLHFSITSCLHVDMTI